MDAKQLIEEIEQKHKITRYRIALDMGVKPSTVYQWESGKKRPNGAHLMELLRRAGRLAAVVFLGTFVGVISTPQDAGASPLQAEKVLNNQTTVYYVKLKQ